LKFETFLSETVLNKLKNISLLRRIVRETLFKLV